jgi:List-Bact-rpt repeat protein
VQTSPATVNGKRNRTRTRNQGGLNAGTRAVVRRYEMYAYTGAYDPITHEALCADLACNAPGAGELGDFLSAQMTAANVAVPSIAVSKVGNGSVTAADKSVSCGSACTGYYNAGAAETLTAAAASGTVFTGWTGACSGNPASCSVVVDQSLTVGATFAQLFTLSIGRSNPGTVTGSPTGTDRAIDCGSTCSAKFANGTVVTLTAVPPVGKTFVSWTGSGAGACALSTVPTCSVAIAKDTSIQANFSK